MDAQSDRFPAFICWLIFVAFVCHTEATGAQGAYDSAVAQTKRDAQNVGGEKSLNFLLPIERALQRILRRTAGDRTLKQLADATIRRRDYTDAKGKPTAYRLNIGEPTDSERAAFSRASDSIRVRLELLSRPQKGGMMSVPIPPQSNRPRR